MILAFFLFNYLAFRMFIIVAVDETLPSGRTIIIYVLLVKLSIKAEKFVFLIIIESN